jgi:hypothetical protein
LKDEKDMSLSSSLHENYFMNEESSYMDRNPLKKNASGGFPNYVLDYSG